MCLCAALCARLQGLDGSRLQGDVFGPLSAEMRGREVCGEEAQGRFEKRQAERAGVVNAPALSLLPAVRAVSDLPQRGCETAKNAGMGLQNRQPLLFPPFPAEF